MSDLPPTSPTSARPKMRTVLHRLWLTGAALAFLLGAGVSGYAVVCSLHDAPIRDPMVSCLRDAQKAEDNANPYARYQRPLGDLNADWIAKCRLNSGSSEHSISSPDTWGTAWVDPST